MDLDLPGIASSCKELIKNDYSVFIGSMRVLSIILSNIINYPNQMKYRTIFTGGESFGPVRNACGALNFLKAINFKRTDDEHLSFPLYIMPDQLMIAQSQLEFTLKKYQKDILEAWVCAGCRQLNDFSEDTCAYCPLDKNPISLKILALEYLENEEQEKKMVKYKKLHKI